MNFFFGQGTDSVKSLSTKSGSEGICVFCCFFLSFCAGISCSSTFPCLWACTQQLFFQLFMSDSLKRNREEAGLSSSSSSSPSSPIRKQPRMDVPTVAPEDREFDNEYSRLIHAIGFFFCLFLFCLFILFVFCIFFIYFFFFFASLLFCIF